MHSACARVRPRLAPTAALAALALLHGLLYLALVPSWQMPDEPTLFEYAGLLNSLGRVPQSSDWDGAVEEAVVASMQRAHFLQWLGHDEPAPPPRIFGDIDPIFPLPRQVGGDPPGAFVVGAALIRLLGDQTIETQLLALRLFSLLCTVGAVACAYGAARELLPAAEDRPFALAVGAFVALQPMFLFIGSGAGNDAPANLIGAALTLALLRLVRRQGPLDLVVVAALALCGALTKRSLIPWALLLVPLSLFLLLLRLLHHPHQAHGSISARTAAAVRFLPRPPSLPLAALLWVVVVGSTGLLAARWVVEQRDEGAVAGWYQGGNGAPVARVVTTQGGAALRVVQGQEAVQALPPIAVEQLRNRGLWFVARLWSDDVATGQLVVAVDGERQAIPFKVDSRPGELRLLAFVPLRGPPTELIIAVERGVVYADGLRAEVATLPGRNLAVNSSLWPALRPGTPLAAFVAFTRLDHIAWAWQSGIWRTTFLSGQQARYVFTTFWGRFGWTHIPIAGSSIWFPLITLVCALSAYGWLYRWWVAVRFSLIRGLGTGDKGLGTGGRGTLSSVQFFDDSSETSHTPPPDPLPVAGRGREISDAAAQSPDCAAASEGHPPPSPGRRGGRGVRSASALGSGLLKTVHLKERGTGGQGTKDGGQGTGERGTGDGSQSPIPNPQSPILLALPAAILLTMAVNATIQPGMQALQQGRYLFPALVPLALLLAGGQWLIVPPRWRARWLIGWLLFWGLLALSGVWSVASFYWG